MLKTEKIKDFMTTQKGIRIAVAVGLSAVVLIFLSSYVDFSGLSSSKTGEEYTEELRTSLLEIISEIDGVGDAKIFLTMDNSGENVYLSNSDTKTKSIEPTVRGVVIVCSGGDDPIVVDRVLSAVTKSLDISSDKVSITKLRSSS